MISKGIRIHWDSSVEYVELDFNDLDHTGPITSTIEWWKEEKEWVKYNTVSQVKKHRDGSVEIQLTYEQARNTHLNPSEICFGKATIRIAPGEESGQAQWDDDAGQEDSGPAKWERVNTPLVGGRKRETVSRIQRKQEEFRAALVAMDEQCVLSDERTNQALEAAHIIPASLGGAEVVENGILLRADLHRLFDAGLFSIGAKGSVAVSKTLEPSYRDMLKGKRLPEGSFKRVKDALEYVKNTRGSV